jgi:PKD repeat protein
VVVPVNLQRPLSAGPATVAPGIFTTGSEDVAITPDQAPVANFSGPAAVQVGQGATFDATASQVAFGAITSFAWDFGDGTKTTTASPTVSHTYTSVGTNLVSVIETDSAGTSLTTGIAGVDPVDGPGQTAYRLAGPSAVAARTITVTPGPPPTNTTTTAPSTTTTNTTAPGQPATTTTTIPGQHLPGTPTLVLNPTVGTPGTIVTVTGTGFLPNTPVTVSWTVSTGSVVIVADTNGNLPPSPLLILTPDVLGPRFAQASSTPQATAPFLVVPSTSEPGGDDAGLLFRSEGP